MKVLIPTGLRPFADGNRQLDFDAVDVADACQQLTQKYPALRPHLLDEQNKLQDFINVYVNDTCIRDLDGEQTQLTSNDELILVPPIAGG